jgi:L-rhamnose isomerase
MNYEDAKECYATWGIDTDQAIKQLSDISISVHCWQGDDVVGFENKSGLSGGGIQATGNHPGRARNPEELRADLEFSYSKIPGSHRLNLHAMYMDTDEKPDRDEIEYHHFETWVDWAKQINIGLDFNPTFFAHSKADDNLTLAHPNVNIRNFWIEHGKRTRDIASKIGTNMGSACINNIWVPDGYKDIPIDRMAARSRLEKSLDAILEKPKQLLKDAVESKLFGIGVEACTVGSHEFYMGYAIRNKTLLCIDMGHFHPTENTADKLSALALSLDEILLHVSRPMRWDSDHVILMNDEVLSMAHELVSADLLSKTNIGLDFFDATISRTAAWVIGTRNMQKALLQSLLKPWKLLRDAENTLDFTKRLIITEELKDLPYGLIWEEFCARHIVCLPAHP